MQITSIVTESPALDTCIPTQPMSRPALEKSAHSDLDIPSGSPVPHHRVEKEGKRRHKKRKPADLQCAVTHHIRDGQIVAGPLMEPGSPAPTAPTPSYSEVDEDARNPPRMRHRKGRENRATKAPLSSPAKSISSGSRNARQVKSSSTKEDVRKALSKSDGIWPEPPTVFSQWDVQVCS